MIKVTIGVALAMLVTAAPTLAQAPIDTPRRIGRTCWLGLFIDRRGGTTIESPEHRFEKATTATLGEHIRRGGTGCDSSVWLIDAAPRTAQRTMKAVIDVVDANLRDGGAFRLPDAYRADDRGVPAPVAPDGQ